jgi:nucleoid-associated protein YgaU
MGVFWHTGAARCMPLVAGMDGNVGDAPEEHAEPQSAAPAQPSGAARRRAWLWIGIVLVVAAIVGVVLGTSLGARQSGPLNGQAGGSGRPTIVVGSLGSPSAVAGVASPSAVPSAVVAEATLTAASTEYVVKPGDTLRSIAEDQYGDAAEWPKIYQANRDVIGPDPDALVAGTTLQLPPP